MKFVFWVGSGSLSFWFGWLLLFALCHEKYDRHYVNRLYPEVVSAKIVTAEDPRPDGEDEEDAAWRIGKLRLMFGWTPATGSSGFGPITECQRSMNRGRSTTCVHEKTHNGENWHSTENHRCGLLFDFREVDSRLSGGSGGFVMRIDGQEGMDIPVSYTDLKGREIKYPNEDLRFFIEWDCGKMLDLDSHINKENPNRLMKGVEVVVENPCKKSPGAQLKVTRVQYYDGLRDPFKYK